MVDTTARWQTLHRSRHLPVAPCTGTEFMIAAFSDGTGTWNASTSGRGRRFGRSLLNCRLGWYDFDEVGHHLAATPRPPIGHVL